MENIRDFHVKYGLGYDGPPRILSRHLHSFRHEFMLEEAGEWHLAVSHIGDHLESGDPPDAAEITHHMAKSLDAIVDVMYVTLGTAYLQGFTEKEISEAWRRVHEANMKKVRGPSPRSEQFDIVKPPGWEPPKLDDLVEHHSYSRPQG